MASPTPHQSAILRPIPLDCMIWRNVFQLCLDSDNQLDQPHYHVRGGSWFDDGTQDALRSNAGFWATDFTPCPHIGFRCALVLGAADVPAEGLTAWWKADGDAKDWMGTHSGEMKDGAVFAPGRDGLAFSFAGTTSHVEVPPDPAWTFGDQEFTIALWAKFPTADVRASVALLFERDGIKRPVDRHDLGWGPALALGPRYLARRSRAHSRRNRANLASSRHFPRRFHLSLLHRR